MTAVSHALIGAAIAAKIPDPYIAGSVSVVTHLMCDAIPHWDLGTNWRLRPKIITGTFAVLETLLAVFGTYFLFQSLVPSKLSLIYAIIFSLIPDWLEAPYFFLQPNPPKFFVYMYKGQSYVHSRMPFPWGVLTQALVVALFLFVGFIV